MTTISDIQTATAVRYGITVADLIGKARTRAACAPRFVAMRLARKLACHSLPEIGRAFGGRDHTTVLNALRTKSVGPDDLAIMAHIAADIAAMEAAPLVFRSVRVRAAGDGVAAPMAGGLQPGSGSRG